MATVVVIGAGLGGIPAAYELRHHLSDRHQVILVSDQNEFTFIPGLIQVALNLKPLEHIQLALEQLTKKHGLVWMPGKVLGIEPIRQHLTIEGGNTIDYDYAVIATGASLAFDQIPGLGPHTGYTQSVCTPNHALQARKAWQAFLEQPGALIVGAAPGAGCFGPAYEFVLLAEQELRRLGLRDQVSLTYITPEPYPGHLGVGGLKGARKLTTDLLCQQGIKVVDNAEIVKVTADQLTLATGEIFPFKYAMILPSFQGAKFIQQVPKLGDQNGFIPILPTCQHPNFPSLYALGVSIQLSQPEQTPVPIGLPKSGQMAEAMAIAVAHNIAVQLGNIRPPLKVPTLEALCFAEYGETGIAYIAAPMIPNPVTGKRQAAYAIKGRWVKWVKAAFEEYFMLKMKFGLGVPWFERVGLQALFGLSLTKFLSTSEHTKESQVSN